MGYRVDDMIYDGFECRDVEVTREQVKTIMEIFNLEDNPNTKHLEIIVYGEKRR